MLSSLPQDLPATYERILARLETRSLRNVRLVLLALSFAKRDLTVDELSDILCIDPNGDLRIKNTEIYWNRLLTSCSSLVSLSSMPLSSEIDSRAHIRLAHFTVKEYLVSKEIELGKASRFALSAGEGSRVMAKLCLACLLYHDKLTSFQPTTLKRDPFTVHAQIFWATHSRDANGEHVGV